MDREFTIEWWQAAAEHSPVAIAFVDKHGRYAYSNAAFSKLLGWSRIELVGKHWTELTPLAEVGEGTKAEQAGQEGRAIEIYETKHLHTKAGTEVLVSIYAHRQPSHGAYEGWIMFVADATTTRQAVDGLRAEYLRLQGRIEGMASEAVRCKEDCLVEIKTAQQTAKETQERLNDLTEALISRANGGGHVRIGGDLTGRDKSNVPTTVLVWMVVAVMALGLAAMGARLLVQHHNGPSVTVEPK